MLLRPGVTCERAIRFLDDLVQGGLNDVRNSVPNFAQPTLAGVEPSKLAGPELVVTLRQYTQWTAKAARELAEVFAEPAVPARLRGEHYSHIVHSPLTPYRTALLLHWELDEVATYFMELQNQMRQTVEEYRVYRQRALVVDANTLLHCQRFDKIPWSRVCGKGPATLVIPHVVVGEIDTKSYSENSEKIKKRARGVYELLTDVLKGLAVDGRYALHDGTEVHVLLDELGHQRLPNNDDEVVARAAHLQQAVAPRQVTVITRDNGMRGKAMTWGLPWDFPPDQYLNPADGFGTKYRVENLDSITVDVPEDGDDT
ncbi:PIN domain-containing protein [Streptacidiphilus anmyonensis]|uniref:PIN domain-containing protein n=1 Tax=Streptacidiphilus anmyonensis TaxID=405782 RepID=UPI0005AB6D4F|nr:PIN domain-containing protein [Streptacidiphilus anmyonensis]